MVDKNCQILSTVGMGCRFVNRAQIKAGMAWWYRAYANEQIPEHRAQYQAAEMDAQRQRITVALIVFLIGLTIFLVIPVWGWIVGSLVMLAGLFMGGKRQKV